MPEPQTRSQTSANDGRIYMPPIENIVPSEGRLGDNRSDSAMMRAFGLEKDMKHWSRMKADGMRFCQEELPPPRLPQNVKEWLGLSFDKLKKLEWCGDVTTRKNYLWEFGLVSWKEKYDYDIQYLQKRFPSIHVKNIICSLFSSWNFDTSAKDLPRKYAAGRDISRLYLQLTSKARVDKDTATDVSTERNDTNERPVLDLTHADVSSDFTSHLSAAETRYAPPKHIDKTGGRDSNLDWENVLLDIQYTNRAESRLEALPLLLICRSVPIVPGNIRMDVIKEELQQQGVATDDFLLRLQGFQDILSWNLRNLCRALVIWRRSRSQDDFDVPLLLIPCSLPDINIDMDREEVSLLGSTSHFITNGSVTAHSTDTEAANPTRSDHATSPQSRKPETDTTQVSVEDKHQDPRRTKRSREKSPHREQSDNEDSETICYKPTDTDGGHEYNELFDTDDNDDDDNEDVQTIHYTQPRSYKRLRRGRNPAQQ